MQKLCDFEADGDSEDDSPERAPLEVALVTKAENGQRLFSWVLDRWPWVGSHQHAKNLARSQHLLVNGVGVADFHHLEVGDKVTLCWEPSLLSLSHTFIQNCIVTDETAEIRLEAFCRATFSNLLSSRRAVRDAIKNGEVLLNNEVVEHTRKLQVGNFVKLQLPAVSALAALCPNSFWPRIVYEDDSVAIVWKHKDVKSSGGWQTVENGARLCVKPSSAIDAFPERAKVVHRLDKPVEGLLILAKTSSCHRVLMSWLRERAFISKVYRAIVWGDPTARLGQQGCLVSPLSLPCSEKLHREWTFQIDFPVDGKPSLTYGRVVECLASCTVLELSPISGRRHQLRLHMEALACPIVGDKEHRLADSGGRRSKCGGLMLAAVALRLPHPQPEHGASDLLDFLEEEPAHFQRWREELIQSRDAMSERNEGKQS